MRETNESKSSHFYPPRTSERLVDLKLEAGLVVDRFSTGSSTKGLERKISIISREERNHFDVASRFKRTRGPEVFDLFFGSRAM